MKFFFTGMAVYFLTVALHRMIWPHRYVVKAARFLSRRRGRDNPNGRDYEAANNFRQWTIPFYLGLAIANALLVLMS